MAPAAAARGALLAGALALGACAGPGTDAAPPAAIDPTFQAAFDTLRAAVEAREDALARAILARILAREPEGTTREHAEAFGRILAGRELVGSLDLRLEARGVGDQGELELALVGSHDLERTVLLRCGGGQLAFALLGMSPSGGEQHLARTQAVAEVAELALPPGEVARVPLGRFQLAAGASLLAVRGTWTLRLGPGEALVDGTAYPAMGVPIAPCEAVRLAPFLPSEPVEPQVLADLLAAGRFGVAALVERAVRIPAARREEALDLLTPVVRRLDDVELERAAPALRWLSGAGSGMTDADAWRGWIERRARQRAGAPVPSLDLPGAARPSATGGGLARRP